jgi:hypothetical protein
MTNLSGIITRHVHRDHVPDQGWPNLDDDQLVMLSKPQKRLRIPLRPVFQLQWRSVLPKNTALRVKKANKAPTLQNEKVG